MRLTIIKPASSPIDAAIDPFTPSKYGHKRTVISSVTMTTTKLPICANNILFVCRLIIKKPFRKSTQGKISVLMMKNFNTAMVAMASEVSAPITRFMNCMPTEIGRASCRERVEEAEGGGGEKRK